MRQRGPETCGPCLLLRAATHRRAADGAGRQKPAAGPGENLGGGRGCRLLQRACPPGDPAADEFRRGTVPGRSALTVGPERGRATRVEFTPDAPAGPLRRIGPRTRSALRKGADRIAAIEVGADGRRGPAIEHPVSVGWVSSANARMLDCRTPTVPRTVQPRSRSPFRPCPRPHRPAHPQPVRPPPRRRPANLHAADHPA